MTLKEALEQFNNRYEDALTGSSSRVIDPLERDWQRINNEYELYLYSVSIGDSTSADTHIDNIIEILNGNDLTVDQPVSVPISTSVISTPDNIAIRTDGSGTPHSGAYDDAISVITIISGLVDDTSNWTFTIDTQSDLTAVIQNDNEVKINSVADDNGYVTVKAEKANNDDLYIRILTYKSYDGVGTYTYEGFASDSIGTDFATTYNSSLHSYRAMKASSSELTPPVVGDFSGLWYPMQKIYTYVAYADNYDGSSGFTTVFSTSKEYYAILIATDEKTPVEGDFTGLWRKMVPQFKVFDDYLYTFFDTERNAIHSTSCAPTRTFNPVSYYHEGTYKRFYFVYFEGAQPAGGNGSSTTRRTIANGYAEEHYNKSWISYYDIESKSFGEQQVFAEDYPRPGDAPESNTAEENAPHNLPVIIVADDGSILVFKEDLDFTGAASLHNSHIEVWKSDSPEDISSFTKVEELGDWSPEYAFAYPNIYKLSDGTIICICRSKGGVGGDYGDGEERYLVIMKSEDNGSTWTDIEDSSDTTSVIAKLDNNGTGWRLYPIHANQSGGINLAAYSYDEVASNDPTKDVYFLHSDDGVTWENARQFVEGSGGYSKNIASAGTITGAELDANFRIDSLPDGDAISLFPTSAGVDRNGIPYVLVSKNDRSDASYNNNTNVYMYYYDATTHAWITVDVLPAMILSGNSDFDVVPRFRATIIPYEDGIVDILTAVTDKDNSDFDSDTVLNSGTGAAGLIYKVVTTDGGLSPYSVGDTFKSAGTETFDANNTVIVVKAKLYRFRTEDYGATFQGTKLNEADYKYGGIGGLGYNINCLDDYKLFMHYPSFETTLGVRVEYQNFLCWFSDLNR
jgi:hypothetical protein